MPGVFISYRREDSSGYAGRLFDVLTAHFGRQNTFMDLDAIEGGDDFKAVIEDKVGASDVVVAVIGPRWLTIADDKGTRRLDNPGDFVRLEICEALGRGMRVIPVLVGGAGIPRMEDLPAQFRPLFERQAIEIRDAHFHSDADQLIGVIRKHLRGATFRPAALTGKPFAPLLLAGAAIAIIALAILLPRHPHAQAPNASTAIAGKWTATVKYDWGDTYNEVFQFEVDGKELSGTASLLGGGRGDHGILEGRIDGNRISFMTKSLTSISSDEKTYEDKHYYKGIVDNDTIRFTMLTDSSIESHVPIHFVANKSKAK